MRGMRGFWQEAMALYSRLQLAAPTGRSPFAALPFPFLKLKVHQAAVLVRRFRFSMVAGCVDQNIKDPYCNTLHLHEVTFMLMAECFHRMCG